MAHNYSATGAAHRAGRTVREAVANPWVTVLARCGYAAKGVVYVIIGWLAMLAAFGAGGKVTDTKGAFHTHVDVPVRS